MNIKPVAGPSQIPVVTTNHTSGREKAIAAFNAVGSQPAAHSQPQTEVVRNQNNIRPEEMRAIVPPTSGQNPNSEELQDVSAQSEETEVQAPVEEAPKTDPALSRQFAQLARQERALRAKAQQQEQAIKAREQALIEREQAISAKDQTYKSGYISKDQIKSDPLSVLAEAGISYDELTQQLINQQPRDPRTEAHIARLEAKLAALEEANTTSQKTYQEQQQAQYNEAVKQIRNDAKNLVMNDPNFETIKATGSIKDVVELITETYNKDGVLLSVEEAAQQVEDYLVEQFSGVVTKVDKLKKRIQANASPTPVQKVQTPATQVQTQPQMKTLTNSTGSSRRLSAKERAILAFKGELK